MAFDPGALDFTLAVVVGDDPALAAELRAVFVDSAGSALVAMRDAADQDAWIDACQRMRGLAASFGALRLMAEADHARDAAVGDPAPMRRIERIIAAF